MNSHKNIITGLIFSVLGFIYILAETNINNLGATPDSVSYIEASRNIFNGSGLDYYLSNRLVARWPPLYPVTLYLVSTVTGIDSIISSGYLSALLFFATIFVFNLIIIKFNANNFTIILLNLLLITSSAMSVYLMIWSEPLFILLLLLIIYILLNWIESGNYLTLFVAGILSGLLIMTRYAGIGFVAGIVVFMLLKKDGLKIKLTNLIIYLFAITGMAGYWIIFLSNQSSGSLIKNTGFHLVSIGHLIQLKTSLMNWISPVFPRLGIVFFVMIFLLIIIYYREHKFNFQIRNISLQNKLIISLLISYFGFLLCFITFVSYIYLENRILAPAFPLILLLLIPVIEEIQKIKSKRLLYFIPVVFVLISCSYSFVVRSSNFYTEGEGYTKKIWLQSETVKILSKYKNLNIFTNGTDVVRFFYNNENTVLPLPSMINSVTRSDNAEFPKEMESMKDSVNSGKSIIVYFDNCDWRTSYPDKQQIKNKFSDVIIDELNDGLILHK